MRLRRTDGFTLVELLVAVVILGIITAALATAVRVTFRTTDEASERLVAAQSVNISASAFGSDAQSADTVFAGDPTGAPCGGSGARLSLLWDDAGVRSVASYHLDAGVLRRTHCVAGQPDRPQTLSATVTSLGVPQCATGSPLAISDCTASGQEALEVAWLVTESNGDTHTLRGTRRAG